MNLKLEAKYLQLEKTRNKLINDLSRLDEALLNTSVEDGKWSINQVVAHLLLVEELTVGYIQRKVQQPGLLRPSSFAHAVNALLLRLALKSWMKFKAPAMAATVPATAALPDLCKRWENIRYKLEDLLTDLPEEVMDKCLFKHPIAGPLSITQTLTFLQDHFDHHLQQIQQLKKQLPAQVQLPD